MTSKEIIRLTWGCTKCGDTVESYSNRRWDMDMCKCKESAVDLEEFYQRNMGYVKEIKREIKNGDEWVPI